MLPGGRLQNIANHWASAHPLNVEGHIAERLSSSAMSGVMEKIDNLASEV